MNATASHSASQPSSLPRRRSLGHTHELGLEASKRQSRSWRGAPRSNFSAPRGSSWRTKLLASVRLYGGLALAAAETQTSGTPFDVLASRFSKASAAVRSGSKIDAADSCGSCKAVTGGHSAVSAR